MATQLPFRFTTRTVKQPGFRFRGGTQLLKPKSARPLTGGRSGQAATAFQVPLFTAPRTTQFQPHLLFRVPASEGFLRVEVSTREFNAALGRFATAFRANATELVKVHTLDLLRRVVMRTPVDTGRLKASEHAVLPGDIDAYSYKDLKGRVFDGTLVGLPVSPYMGFVGTNVHYAIYPESGSSRQAPNGMFAVSLKEKTGELERDLEQMMPQAWSRT